MTISLMPAPLQRFVNNAGLPAARFKLYTFAAGTSTPMNAWQDPAGLVPHENPITLDMKGEVLVYFTDANYKIDLRDPVTGQSVSGYPVDNFPGFKKGEAAQYETQTALAGQKTFTLGSISYTPGISSLHLYLDGLRVTPADYVETSAKVVTFKQALSKGQEVLFEAGSAVNSSLNVDAATVPYTPAGGVAMNVAAALDARQLLPTAFNPKILVIGSSTAAGSGSSTGNVGADGVATAKSWVGILAAKLAAQASAYDATPWTVVNAAVGGWRAQEVLASFYGPAGNSLRSPAIERPDIVVLALTVGNEGITTVSTLAEKDAIARLLLRRTLKIAHMVRQLGARFVVTLQYTRLAYTAADYELVKRMNRDLDQSGIATINFLGALDDGTGLYRTGMDADGIHPNDNGHEALARTVSLSLFERLQYEAPPWRASVAPRGFTVPAGATTGGPPVLYNSATIGEMPFGSWTLFFRMKNTGQSTSQFAFASAYTGTNSLRIRNSSAAGAGVPLCVTRQDNVDLVVDAGYAPRTDFNEHSVAMSFDSYTNTVSMYRDGVLIGTYPNAYAVGQMDFTQFSVGGKPEDASVNAPGFTFRDIALYRVRLTPEQHEEMHRGVFSKASCEIFAPCTDSTFKSGHRLANLAPTAAQFKVGTNADLTPAKLP